MEEYHYRYFKDLYDEESRRTVGLHDNAKVNTAIVSLYAAFVGIQSSQHENFSLENISSIAFVAALLFLFLSITLSLYTTRIAKFEVPNYPEAVLRLLPSYLNQSDFYEDRVADLVAAYETNSEINDETVDYLLYARIFLLLGLFSHFSYFMLKLIGH